MRKLSHQLTQSILAQHRTHGSTEPKAILRDGRTVVDRYVDSDNHLHFVVQGNDGQTEVINAQGAGVEKFLGRPTGHTQTIKNTATTKESNEESAKSEPTSPRIQNSNETTTSAGLDHGRASG